MKYIAIIFIVLALVIIADPLRIRTPLTIDQRIESGEYGHYDKSEIKPEQVWRFEKRTEFETNIYDVTVFAVRGGQVLFGINTNDPISDTERNFRVCFRLIH